MENTTDLNNFRDIHNCELNYTHTEEEEIAYLFVMTPIAFVGLILNFLCLKIFQDRSFKTIAFKYLRLTSAADLIICTLVIPYCVTMYTRFSNKYDLFVRHLYLAYIFIPLTNIGSNLTMLLTLLVTSERLVSIRWPTKRYKLFNESRYRFSCVAVILIAFLLNTVNFVLYKVELCKYDPKPRRFTETTYWKIYGFIKEVLLRVLPIISLVISNIVLIHTVRMSRKRIKQSTAKNISENKISKRVTSNNNQLIHTKKSHRQDTQITFMTIFVAIMYSICIIPMVFAYPGLVFDETQTNTSFYKVYAAFANILELSQSSFRFIIYFCFTTQFRNVAYKKLNCRNKRLENQYTLSSLTRDFKTLNQKTSNQVNSLQNF